MARAICECNETDKDGTVTITIYDDGFTTYFCKACYAKWDYQDDPPIDKIHGMYGADKE